MSLLSQPELSRWEGIIHGLRVNELQSVLGHFKSNKLGKKQELVARCISILRTPLYQQEVTRFISTTMHNTRPPVRSTPYHIPNNLNANRYGATVGGWGTNSYGNGGATLSSLTPQVIHNLRAVPLPFYDLVHTIMQPMRLAPIEGGMKTHRKETMSFVIPLDHMADLKYREGQKPLPRREVQLRFFFLDTNYALSEQADEFPLNCAVRVDDQGVTLPNIIPTNKPNVEPKRPSRPVNITQYCQANRDASRPYRLTVEWTADRRAWAVGIYLVNRLSSDILRDRALSNAQFRQPLETTKQTIIRRLGGAADEDITMDQIKISLLCPLGRTRMKVPARCRDCTHLQCFDLDLYLMMNEKRPTWKCAVCSGPAPYGRLIVDGYFQKMLADVSTDTSEVELLKDGSYQTIREEVNELSDSDDEPVKPIVANGSGDARKPSVAAVKKPTTVPDDDIIILDSDEEDEPLRQALQASIADIAKKPCTPPRKNNDIDIICLDDTPPREKQNNQQQQQEPQQPLSLTSLHNGSIPSSSATSMGAAASTSSSSQLNLNGSQAPRPPVYQQMMNQMNTGGYNFSANWGIPMGNTQPQQQNGGFQRPGTFIGGNMPSGYMPNYYPMSANQLGQNNYRPNNTQPSPQNNLAHLLHSINPSYQQPNYHPNQ